MMTSLGKLTNLKKIVVVSNLEAFAPSFTIPAVKCWSGLQVLEFKDRWESPPKNKNLDFELIDLDSIVRQIVLSHGSTLQTLKIDFPFHCDEVDYLTSISLGFISQHCTNLKSLWLLNLSCTDESLLCLSELSNLESLTFNLEGRLTLIGLKDMLGICRGFRSSAFPNLKECVVHSTFTAFSQKDQDAFDRLQQSVDFHLDQVTTSYTTQYLSPSKMRPYIRFF